MADKKKGVQLTESLARRLVGMLHEFERRERQPKATRRIPKSSGYLPILRYKLTEALNDNDHATATLTTQDASDGTWDDGTSPDDDEEIYSDSSTFSTGAIASGSYVLAWRNPATGLLNLLQGPCAT
jgi:hypothetical protein